MTHPRKAELLHGVTLKAMLEHLVERYGWDGLGQRIAIRSFTHDPSITSSLKFLRKTPWARDKVESLYVHSAAHPRKGIGTGVETALAGGTTNVSSATRAAQLAESGDASDADAEGAE